MDPIVSIVGLPAASDESNVFPQDIIVDSKMLPENNAQPRSRKFGGHA